MTLGERIKNKRREYRLTLEELSKKIGISRQTLSKYELGTITNIPSDKIELLASALHTTPAYLMGWEEDDIMNINKVNKNFEIREMEKSLINFVNAPTKLTNYIMENEFTEDELDFLLYFAKTIVENRK